MSETVHSTLRQTTFNKLQQFFRDTFGIEKSGVASRRRRFIFEPLEERVVLSASPMIFNLPTEINIIAGTTYHVALDGILGDNSTGLTYTVSSTNAGINASVLSGNQSIKMHIVQYNDDGTVYQDFGYLIFELFESETPITTTRIKNLVEQHFYDGLTFHRVIEDFMIQGGDPEGTGRGGSGLGKLPDEFSSFLSHNTAGILAMANSGANTGDCQFFITDGAVVRLDNVHTIFGFITQGDAIRHAINSVATDGNDVPLKKIVIESMEVINDTENGTLRITTNAQYTGTDIITVTVKDQLGNETEYEIKVNVQQPIIDWIEPIEMKAGTSITIELTDINGFGEYITTRLSGTHPGMTYEIVDGNKLVITADATVSGLQGATLIVDDMLYYGQYLWVYVSPSAPNATLTGGDTGILGDGITSANNADDDSRFTFTMDNIIPQTEKPLEETLKLYMNGKEIPFRIVSVDTDDATELLKVVVETIPGEANKMADGTYVFEFVQYHVLPSTAAHPEPLISDKSTAIVMKVVTKAPLITSPVDDFEFNAELEEELKIPLTTNQDSNGDVTFTITSGNVPPGMEIVKEGNQYYLKWTPAAEAEAGDYPVTITATNSGNFSSSVTITVVVQGGGPQFVIDGEKTINEEETLELDLSPVEGEEELEGTITYTIVDSTLPEGADVTIESTGDQTARFTWNTVKGDGPGTYVITFLATDENGATRRKSVVVTVNKVYQPPTFDPIGDEPLQAKERDKFEYTFTAHADGTPSGKITYSLIGNIEDGMTINADTGKFSWTPGKTHAGSTYTVTVEATDEFGNKTTLEFEVAVEKRDDPPVFSPMKNPQFFDDIGTFQIRINATDPDMVNDIKYSLVGTVPEGMTIDPTTGVIQWNVPQDYLGQWELQRFINVTVKATEIIVGENGETSDGLSSTLSLQFEIINRQFAMIVSAASAKKNGVGELAKPTLPETVGLQMTTRQDTMNTTTVRFETTFYISPIDRRFRNWFDEISFGIDDSAEFIEEGGDEGGSQRMQEQTLLNPISPNFWQGIERGFAKTADSFLDPTEAGSRIKKAFFDLYEASQELELAHHVVERPTTERQATTQEQAVTKEQADTSELTNRAVMDRAILDLAVEGRAENTPVTTVTVSKDVFNEALNQAQQGKPAKAPAKAK